MKLGALEFGAYLFRIVMSPLLHSSLSLSLLTSFSLKSVLPDIHVAMPVYFLVPLKWTTFVHPFTLRQYLFLKLGSVSQRQQIDVVF